MIDVTAAKQALAKSHNKAVRAFAAGDGARPHRGERPGAGAGQEARRDAAGQPDQPVAVKDAAAEQKKLAALDGAAFDKAYAANEVAYHKTVNGALSGTLIPSAQNAELKSLLQTGLKLFKAHQMHAEHLAQSLK